MKYLKKSNKGLKMIRIAYILFLLILLQGCSGNNNQNRSLPVARAGRVTLYYDEIPQQIIESARTGDSVSVIHNYISKWARQELLYQKADANLAPAQRNNIERHLMETRLDLVIYEYQRMMMLQKMDTVISATELSDYYESNSGAFNLNSNIVKALFIKLPVETPNLNRIKSLARSTQQKDLQELESLCFQFAEKFDDFNEQWITFERLLFEMKEQIPDQENFLRRTGYHEKNDSSSVYLVVISDYRLRGTLAPFDYVKEDIKRIIWNNRRLEFIKTLENGIYNEAVKGNGFKIF